MRLLENDFMGGPFMALLQYLGTHIKAEAENWSHFNYVPHNHKLVLEIGGFLAT
jgi:hypothetical protein